MIIYYVMKLVKLFILQTVKKMRDYTFNDSENETHNS